MVPPLTGSLWFAFGLKPDRQCDTAAIISDVAPNWQQESATEKKWEEARASLAGMY